MEKHLAIHVKVITPPTKFSINEMVSAMRNIFSLAEIVVDSVSCENLNVSNPAIIALDDLDTGSCRKGTPSPEQIALSNFRTNAGSTDVVAYFCRSVSSVGGALNGCASFPTGRPMVALASYSSLYTLAHEVGHVLGLAHVNNNDMLMTGNGTANITHPPPDLIASEISTMRSSPFIH